MKALDALDHGNLDLALRFMIDSQSTEEISGGAHVHANLPTLNSTTVSFTTALKSAYDAYASSKVNKSGDTIIGDVRFQSDVIIDSQGHSIKFQDSHDSNQHDDILSVLPDATIVLGSGNTNGVTLLNNQDYKIESSLNPGTCQRIAIVTSDDVVHLGSSNSAETHFHAGGDNGIAKVKIHNGGTLDLSGDMHVAGHLLFGSDGGTVLDGNVDIVEVQSGNPALGTAGVGIASYRDSDEWGSFCFGVRYRGTLASPTAVHNGDYLMEFGGLGWDGAGGAIGGGELAWVVDGAPEAGKIPSKALISVTTAAGVTTNGLVITPDLQVEAFGIIKATGFKVGSSDGVDHTEVINGKTFVWTKGLLTSVTP